jgi:hypothetical protein
MNESDINQNRHINTSSTIVHFTPDEIGTTSQRVCRYAGGTGYKMNANTASLVSKTLQRARQLIAPALVYAIYPVSELLTDGTLLLENRISLALPSHERDVHTRYVAAVICTIGTVLGITCRKLADQGELLQFLFLDACGVALIETLAQRAYELISQKAGKENLYVGCRFAPGYAGMSLSNQSLLFNLVDGAVIGVRLNTHLIMNPSKSLSFFIRLTESKTSFRGINKCEQCPVSDCNFRIRRAQASQER